MTTLITAAKETSVQMEVGCLDRHQVYNTALGVHRQRKLASLQTAVENLNAL